MPSRQPFIASAVLTLGTMAIPATVVRDGAQHFAVQCVNPMPVVLDESIALSANDISHLERWPGHFFFSLRERWTRSALEIFRASSGLLTACRCLRDRCR